MRILHVIPQFHYFGGRTIVGGHASCVLSLSLAQHAAGKDVTILSYLPGHSGIRIIDDGPQVYSLFSDAQTRTFRFGLQFYRAAKQWLEARRKDFDVVHVHSGFADYFLVSGGLKKTVGLPTLHTMYCPIPAKGGRWRLPGIHTMIKRWAKCIDWHGGISQNVADSMVHYGMRDVDFVRPAVDVDRFQSGTDGIEVRRQLGLGEEHLVILFVGNAKPQKNAAGVLRAFHFLRKEFPNSRLVITTELKHTSSDEDLAALATLARELELEDFIVQRGIVDNMPALMHTSDVLVAPFLDSFGPSDYFMAALEAMACGKPVVVSNVGGMPEVVTEDVGSLVDPFDFKSIAGGLRPLLANEELRKRKGLHARRVMERYFDPHDVICAYDEIYGRIAS